MNIHVVAILVSVAIFLFVIDLVRRRRLTFKYAMGWLFVSGGAIFFAVFYRLLAWFRIAQQFYLLRVILRLCFLKPFIDGIPVPTKQSK